MPQPKNVNLSFLLRNSAVKGKTGLRQRFQDVHTDTPCQTREGLLNPGDMCRALGKASGENLFSNLTEKCQIFLAERRFCIPSSPTHTMFPQSSSLSKKAENMSVCYGSIGSLLKEGRIKVELTCTLTLHYLVFRRLILGTLSVLEGH